MIPHIVSSAAPLLTYINNLYQQQSRQNYIDKMIARYASTMNACRIFCKTYHVLLNLYVASSFFAVTPKNYITGESVIITNSIVKTSNTNGRTWIMKTGRGKKTSSTFKRSNFYVKIPNNSRVNLCKKKDFYVLKCPYSST